MNKFLLFTTLSIFSLHSFAQVAWFPVGKEGANLNYTDKGVCEYSEGQPCYDTSKCEPEVCDLADNMVVDFIRKEHEEKCESGDDCQSKLESLKCDAGKPIKNLEDMSVYCAVEFMKKDGKKLVESESKKVAKLQVTRDAENALKTKEAAKKLIKEKFKNLDVDKATTVKQLSAIVKEIVEFLKD